MILRGRRPIVLLVIVWLGLVGVIIVVRVGRGGVLGRMVVVVLVLGVVLAGGGGWLPLGLWLVVRWWWRAFSLWLGVKGCGRSSRLC
jgi:hypothetical protein